MLTWLQLAKEILAMDEKMLSEKAEVYHSAFNQTFQVRDFNYCNKDDPFITIDASPEDDDN